MIIYAIVTEDYETDGIPALFLSREHAEEYLKTAIDQTDERYIVVETVVM